MSQNNDIVLKLSTCKNYEAASLVNFLRFIDGELEDMHKTEILVRSRLSDEFKENVSQSIASIVSKLVSLDSSINPENYIDYPIFLEFVMKKYNEENENEN